MTQTEKKEFQKAYVELYEIIKVLPNEEQKKIPKLFLKNLKNNMDKECKFILNKDGDILNQNYRIETKALFIELYEKYLVPKEDWDFWNKYDKICDNMIEEEKRIKYDTENIFKNRKLEREDSIANNNLPIEIKDKNIFIKFLNFMKKILKRK